MSELASSCTAVDPAAAVVAEIERLLPQLITWRRDLHAHPEIARRETRTTAFLRDTLTAAGIAVTALPGTGLIADLGATDPTRRIALRADLDALPVPERSGLPFRSTVEGLCHACGHDVHTTVVLGVALALKTIEPTLVARDLAVRCIFQPAEEVMPGGAHDVLAAGVLDDVDRALAVHCDPSIDVGTVGLTTGPITAACDQIEIALAGPGGHTSRPHLSADLTFALGKVLTEVPAVLSRRLDPRSGVALVWGQVEAGNAANVIPATGHLVGTLRMLDADEWKRVGGLVEQVVHEIVAPYKVAAQVQHIRGVPPVVNDAAAIAALAAAARASEGDRSVVPTRQSLGGEDFSWLLQATPGALARLGTRAPDGPTYELHQGDLVIDEAAIGVGSRMLALAALSEA
ncbi:amidohydrolase [Flexivirga endophytica]|uniref:Amidohydrolase n=1 Tax=Flexivirga endophytica TaxID=1849103 RepID=A0A916WXS9_9MICO|nr:amidohydrolase [Flexivirga endophytica]GGB38270.1 amidohydrolase [Flexivirga endophytica]GHB46238.1 amidohydrolase [Flexivirga endophytica]